MSTFSNLFGIALIGQFVTPIFSFLNVLLSLLVYQCIIFQHAKHEKLSRLFTKRGWRQTHYIGPGKYPGEGWCILFIHWGFVVGYKSCVKREQKGDDTQYHLYIFGSAAYAWIHNKLEGDKRLVAVEFISNPTIWRCETTRTSLSITNEPSKWQDHLLDQIIRGYTKQKRFSVLLHGAPGVGKSEVAYFLNREIAKNNCAPVTVVCDPTKRGLSLGHIITGHSKDTPNIVVFNEYDSIIRHAESTTKDTKSDGMSLADTRTSFLDMLDQLEKTRYVILIATTNADPEADIPFVYRRPGRMDLVYGVPKDAKPFE